LTSDQKCAKIRSRSDRKVSQMYYQEGVSYMWWTWQVYDLYQKELQEKMEKRSSKWHILLYLWVEPCWKKFKF